ncbi:MAG: 2-oxoacid:acceptor oxidoreductase family protein [Oscillospiraceae bacterium]|nr:2-oxoacid:acceptor oxidoreductase family protein [Oscillospiraceae bacterium]
MMDKVIIAGQGGQGALRIGQMLAYAAINEGKEATWLPSYGAEMRGGTANCGVTISDRCIASPTIMKPDSCIVMNKPSLLKFEKWVVPAGSLFINASMVSEKASRGDIRIFYIPADAIAEEEGNPRGANMVMLGAYLAAVKSVLPASIFEIIDHSFTGDKAKYADANKRLVRRGMDFIERQ